MLLLRLVIRQAHIEQRPDLSQYMFKINPRDGVVCVLVFCNWLLARACVCDCFCACGLGLCEFARAELYIYIYIHYIFIYTYIPGPPQRCFCSGFHVFQAKTQQATQ